jgi:hypothetical protein
LSFSGFRAVGSSNSIIIDPVLERGKIEGDFGSDYNKNRKRHEKNRR